MENNSSPSTPIHTHTHTPIDICICVHTQTHTYIHVYMCKHRHTHTHIFLAAVLKITWSLQIEISWWIHSEAVITGINNNLLGGGGHVLNCMHVHICVCVLFMSELIVLLRLIIFIYFFIFLRLFSNTSRGSLYSCQTVVEARSQLHPNKEWNKRQEDKDKPLIVPPSP